MTIHAYAFGVSTDLRKIIAKNVQAAIQLRYGEKAGVGALVRHGIPNGNASRIFHGVEKYGVETLETVAALLRVPVWKLCNPRLTFPALEIDGSEPEPAAQEPWPLDPFISRERWGRAEQAHKTAAAWEAHKALTSVEHAAQTSGSPQKRQANGK